MNNCLVCERINQINNKTNKFFVYECKTGYLVLADNQYYKGYCMFLSKIHANELHELSIDFKNQYLQEMSLMAEAVFRAFSQVKLNYELLGNKIKHLHWHIVPRYQDDPDITMPIWIIPKDVRCSLSTIPNDKELRELKNLILHNINLIKK